MNRGWFAGGLIATALLVGCGDDGPPDQHGYVKVLFLQDAAATADPYAGTAEAIVVVDYQACYQTFFEANPSWTAVGEDGASAYRTREDGGEGWQDRLCEVEPNGRADCEVLSIEQQIQTNANRLVVQYRINGQLNRRKLYVGPLPLSSLAGCDNGRPPTVQLSQGGTRGLNAGGSQLWSVGVVEGEGLAAPGDEIDVQAGSG